MTALTRTRTPACNSEQAALEVFGFTQVSWDNVSGKEPQPQPSSWNTVWNELTENERAAVSMLGYNEMRWNNQESFQWQPAAFFKSWDELTKCSDGEHILFTVRLPILTSVTLFLLLRVY